MNAQEKVDYLTALATILKISEAGRVLYGEHTNVFNRILEVVADATAEPKENEIEELKREVAVSEPSISKELQTLNDELQKAISFIVFEAAEPKEDYLTIFRDIDGVPSKLIINMKDLKVFPTVSVKTSEVVRDYIKDIERIASL